MSNLTTDTGNSFGLHYSHRIAIGRIVGTLKKNLSLWAGVGTVVSQTSRMWNGTNVRAVQTWLQYVNDSWFADNNERKDT